MKTLSDIIEFVRLQLDASNQSFWTDEEITKYINQAKDDLFVAMSTTNMKWFIKTISLTKDYGDDTLELPEDFNRVNRLTCTDQHRERIPFAYYDVNSRQFKDIAVNDPQETADYNYSLAYFPYDIKRTADQENIMYLAPRYLEINFDMEYTASDPDLVETTDTFNMFANHLGYIQDQAIQYCFRKGPSGPYEKYEIQAKNKLRDILTSLNNLEAQSPQFVTGFGE